MVVWTFGTADSGVFEGHTSALIVSDRHEKGKWSSGLAYSNLPPNARLAAFAWPADVDHPRQIIFVVFFECGVLSETEEPKAFWDLLPSNTFDLFEVVWRIAAFAWQRSPNPSRYFEVCP